MNDKDLNNTSGTNWAALKAMTDEEIDYSGIPPLTEEFFEKATLRIPANLTHRFVQRLIRFRTITNHALCINHP